MKKIYMTKFLILIMALFIVTGCSKGEDDNKEEVKDNSNQLVKEEKAEENLETLLANVSFQNSSDGENDYTFILDDVILVYEDDGEAISKYGLGADDFWNGYATVNENPDWKEYRLNKDSEILMVSISEETGDWTGPERVSPEAFMEEADYHPLGYILSEVTLEGDYIKKIVQLDENKIWARTFVKEEESVINNGGNFVKYGDSIYFRRFNNDNFYREGTWMGFEPVPKSLSHVSRLRDGIMQDIFVDDGHGQLFIYERKNGDPIFISSKYIEDEDYPESFNSEVYALDFEGKLFKSYGSGYVFAIDQSRGLIIVNDYPGTISIIDIETGDRNMLDLAYSTPTYYDKKEGVVYSEDHSGAYGDNAVTLISTDLNSLESKKIFEISMEELNILTEKDYSGGYFALENVRLSGDYMWFYMAGYEVYNEILSSSLLIKLNKNKGSYEILSFPSEVDWFGLNKPFNKSQTGPFFEDDDRYYIFTEGRLSSPKEVLSKNDLDKIGLDGGDYYGYDYFRGMGRIELVGDEIYFSISSGLRNEDMDFEWVFGYNRGETQVYKKDLVTGEIEIIHSY